MIVGRFDPEFFEHNSCFILGTLFAMQPVTQRQEKKWDTDTEKQKPDTIRSSGNERCEMSFL